MCEEGVKNSHGNAMDKRLEELMDSFSRRVRQGDRPSIEEYAQRNPELADQIRSLFPALQFVEKGQRVHEAPTTPGVESIAGRGAEGGSRRLGDYRILRELGQGGMGVVYEAEQESLGRRVALKILPSWASMDSRRRERFLLEARVAATLQHPNIVPVYAVSEEDRVLYYVMQFVQGQGLDEVLVELIRLREKKGKKSDNPDVQVPENSMATSVAWSLASGSWPEESSPEDRSGCNDSAEAGTPQVDTPVETTGAEEDRRPLSLGDSDRSPSAQRTWRPPQYFRNVARLGVQVAGALAYAHENEVLHRDIKPSNLLLDAGGTVWITDFGLAKARGSEDLTQSGEILGTLRYMAPERFRGRSDLLGDVYSLGLTLYELLTLEPAFESSDRGTLMQRIADEEPPRPRKIDPLIPRDLETVVLKAMAKEPASRYETASELADDLNRFLRDEPVRARPSGVVKRSVKWAKRRPAAAALVLVIAVAVVGMFAGTLRYNIRLLEENERARANLLEALEAVKRMLVRVGSEDLALVPDAGYLRRGLLEEALEFQRRFLERSPKDPLIRLEAARVQAQAADLWQLAGFRLEAGEAYHRALVFLEDLGAEFPPDEAIQKELATVRAKARLLEDPGLPASGARVSRFQVGDNASNLIDVAAADFDGDDRMELVSANQGTSNVTVFRAHKPREFTAADNFPTGLGPYQIVVCDFDGKNGPDVATFGRITGHISVLLNRGDATFEPMIQKHPGFNPWFMLAYDLDGNKLDEIAVVGQFLRIARWETGGTIVLDQPVQIPENGNSLAAGDFDGDGSVDLVVGCAPKRKGLLSVRWGDGEGAATGVSEFRCAIMPLDLLAADVDGDGDQDLALFDSISDRVEIALNEGSRVFRPGEPMSVVKHTFPLAAGDFDSDGDMDVATCDEVDGRITFLLGDGRGEFSYGRRLLTGGRAFRGTAADLDADGQLDLAIANGPTDDVAVMFHLREHLNQAPEGPKEGDSSGKR